MLTDFEHKRRHCVVVAAAASIGWLRLLQSTCASTCTF